MKPNDDTDANPSWAWTAGAAISTVGDLAVYVKALVGGGLVDAATQKLRLDSITPIDSAHPGVGYGLGIARFGPLIGHDGQIPGYESSSRLRGAHSAPGGVVGGSWYNSGTRTRLRLASHQMDHRSLGIDPRDTP